ncbi:hypothetical protein A1Q2_04131 [Trichosporon asahii var. asahii CBS 8904]|uniref:Uncharacterized protein n=1 Tax=Trichosporon asahii var. asahii (strain CBS 8904) TaxID=1220162 RepID=K1VC60_TRIAC|nr:hypothetical protein A1Q2_04131 [Trichosporon asahii var. asahii CBS 8904]
MVDGHRARQPQSKPCDQVRRQASYTQRNLFLVVPSFLSSPIATTPTLTLVPPSASSFFENLGKLLDPPPLVSPSPSGSDSERSPHAHRKRAHASGRSLPLFIPFRPPSRPPGTRPEPPSTDREERENATAGDCRALTFERETAARAPLRATTLDHSKERRSVHAHAHAFWSIVL